MVGVMIGTEPPAAAAAGAGAAGSAFGASVFAASALGASAFGASAFAAAGAADAPSLTTPRTAPGVTVSPSGALISDSTPSAGDTTSSETLSVSSSTRTSSFFTGSPAFFVHLPMVASVTDSPRAGVRMSAMVGSRSRSGQDIAYQAKASVRKASSSFRCRLIRPAAVEAEAGRPT